MLLEWLSRYLDVWIPGCPQVCTPPSPHLKWQDNDPITIIAKKHLFRVHAQVSYIYIYIYIYIYRIERERGRERERKREGGFTQEFTYAYTRGHGFSWL
jgi:hypothetical protein